MCSSSILAIFLTNIAVVYFDQQMGALHPVRWLKSSFSGFNIFVCHKQEKRREKAKRKKNTWKPTKMLHLLFVWGQNKLKFACPYFILWLMLFFSSHLLSFLVTGRALSPNSPQKWTACIVTSLHSHFAGGLNIKKA